MAQPQLPPFRDLLCKAESHALFQASLELTSSSSSLVVFNTQVPPTTPRGGRNQSFSHHNVLGTQPTRGGRNRRGGRSQPCCQLS